MTNLKKASPGVEIEIGGKVRKLIFNMRAFMLLEKATGKNALNGEIFGSPSVTDLITLTWAALQHGEEDLRPSIEDVADWITFEDFAKLTEGIKEAFDEATPAPPKNAKTAKPNAEK